MDLARPVSSRFWRSHSGTAVVEFAFVLPILLLLVFGVAEFGRALMTSNVLYAAAREGARLAAVGRSSGDVAARIDAVLDAANVADEGRTITVTGPGTNHTITVAVQADFAVVSGQVLPIPGTIRLAASTTMRSEL
jgi:Flp pilus assembly protein TadG